MHQNLHAYRNLGVTCLIMKCEFCSLATPHSAYFELDAERRKRCTLGCTECGRSKPLTEEQYEALYDASYDYDSWQGGEMSFEAYQNGLPEEFRSAAEERVQKASEREWNCKHCGENVPDSLSECWNCGYAPDGTVASAIGKEREDAVPVELGERSNVELATVRLSNGLGPLLNFGISLGIALQFVLAGLIYLGWLPNLIYIVDPSAEAESADASWGTMLWMPLGMVLSIGLGAAVSYHRFPKRVTISKGGIRIRPRGAQSDIHYGFESVRQARYGDGSKYLTLWFTDGKAYLARITSTDVLQLRHYFQMTR